MFSGKTSELIRHVKRYRIANRSVSIYKNTLDTRYKTLDIVTHERTVSLPCIPISDDVDLKSDVFSGPDTDVIAIDEIQFFSPKFLPQIQNLLEKQKEVLIAGLNQDSEGKPFGIIADLCAMADTIILLTAVCTDCGALATKTARINTTDDQPKSVAERIAVGSFGMYKACCNRCWYAAREEK